MIGIYAAAVVICLASLLIGRALFIVLGRRDWTWLEGAVGLAALIVIARLAIGAPEGAFVSVVVCALLLAGAVIVVAGDDRPPRGWIVAAAVLLLVLAAAALPFALNDRTGVLGEGIYSNDHAVHLYWADWLQTEIGDRPKGIGWGYPVGPHALVATVSEATGVTIQTAFNGLLLAIPALTALTALAALGALHPVLRTVAATLVGLPFLGVAFLAQSSFKETAIALFVLALALLLAALSREGPGAGDRAGAHPNRALVVGLVLLAAASVLTFSLPGLAWFALAAAIWLVLELVLGRLPFSPTAAIAGLRRGWPAVVLALALLGGLAVIEAETVSRFAERIQDVQESQGRLARRLPPWQMLGIWPEGDFRVQTDAIELGQAAALFGLVCLAVAGVWWVANRELAVPATIVAALLIYIAARLTSGIHVEGKAMVAATPLLTLLIVRGLLDPGKRAGIVRYGRLGLGILFVAAALGSSFLAFRATPVGSDAHADELSAFRGEVAGKRVLFLGLDRFAPYRLRGAARVQSPGGYVPNPLRGRGGKEWAQGEPLGFDSVESFVLDRFRYAVTTGAAYGSSAPDNWERVTATRNFVLWERIADGEERLILRDEDVGPGAIASCDLGDPFGGAGTAGIWPTPPILDWDQPWSPDAELRAGETVSAQLDLPAGSWYLSLQYNAEVPLRLRSGDLETHLPAALDGFYASAPGMGAFWPAGELSGDGGSIEIEVSAAKAPEASRLVGAQRHAWLGDIAAVPVQEPQPEGAPGPHDAQEVPISEACSEYVDWYMLDSDG